MNKSLLKNVHWFAISTSPCLHNKLKEYDMCQERGCTKTGVLLVREFLLTL